jgi:hypothetical protein
MPSLDLLQNGTRVFAITSCGSIARREELISNLRQRTYNHDWVISQPAIHNLAEAANRRRILNRGAAKLHDHASRTSIAVSMQLAHQISPEEIKNPPASCFWRWVFVSR